MFNKILIANRGEIAVRIIRACREMGLQTVAVYSEADKEALHTQLADESVCIGKAAAKDSYLNMERILSATVATHADAIHPGFGFLSENSKFASLCEKCNITFIGPDSDIIEKTGNKQEARNTMISAGIPVIPGTKEPVMDAERGKELADNIGYPVMVDKALEKYRKHHTGFTLQRYKGLGEMDPKQLWETTLNPETRILKQVEIEDAKMASDVTSMLMGSEVAPRRNFIYTHATDAELDI